MTGGRILLIRHGETDWNAEGRGQGFAMTDLNAKGREQAQALAAYFATRPILKIYSSDLPRAAQTASPLAQKLGVQPQLDERWREINLGIFEGLTLEEAAQQMPLEIAARRRDYWAYTPARGESRRALQERAYNGFLDVAQQVQAETVAVVSHGGTIKALLQRLFGEDDARLRAPLTNTSVTTLQRCNGKWDLLAVAKTPHL